MIVLKHKSNKGFSLLRQNRGGVKAVINVLPRASSMPVPPPVINSVLMNER